jgi:hypothetical protein
MSPLVFMWVSFSLEEISAAQQGTAERHEVAPVGAAGHVVSAEAQIRGGSAVERHPSGASRTDAARPSRCATAACSRVVRQRTGCELARTAVTAVAATSAEVSVSKATL